MLPIPMLTSNPRTAVDILRQALKIHHCMIILYPHLQQRLRTNTDKYKAISSLFIPRGHKQRKCKASQLFTHQMKRKAIKYRFVCICRETKCWWDWPGAQGDAWMCLLRQMTANRTLCKLSDGLLSTMGISRLEPSQAVCWERCSPD